MKAYVTPQRFDLSPALGLRAQINVHDRFRCVRIGNKNGIKDSVQFLED